MQFKLPSSVQSLIDSGHLCHNCKAVHCANARKAKVELPSLGEYERQQKALGAERASSSAAPT